MYYVKKTMEVSASHSLSLNYESKCQAPHGHNWQITVYCKSRQLDVNGIGVLDHRNLNEVLPFNPTAENIARWCCEQVEQCYRVEVQESLGNVAVYEDDDFDETH